MKLGDAKPQTRGDNARLEDIVELAKLPNNKWVQLRILDGDILSYRQHWINILTTKTKREVRIPKLCLAHNPQTEAMDGECPYCEIESQGSASYLVNVIVRTLQDDEPGKIRVTSAERESGFKDMTSESWTPVRVLRLTSGLMKKIQELKALNKVKGKTGVKVFDVNHDKFGVDLNIKYDENAKGPEKYQVNMAEKTPLSEAELGYLRYDLHEGLISQMGLESLADAKKELARMQIVGAEEFDSTDDEDEGDNLGKKKKPAGKPAPKKKPAEDDFDDDEDDEDDEPAPKKKPAGKPASKKKPVDEDDEDDFDDEDDEPAPKRKSPPSKKKPVDEDDDDDFDDEDDEDDEPAPKRKSPPAKKPAGKPAPKKKPVDEDDEDDFDDEDDEPAPKKKPAGKPAPKKKPAPVDEDDEDDFDDEDDEPAPKKKPAAKKPAGKPASKKKPVDEDDEDEDNYDDDEDDDDEPF